MKRSLGSLAFIFISFISVGQDDTILISRAQSILKFTQSKDWENIMDYTYPKLFSIVPRDQLIEVMKGVFENDEFSVDTDSLEIIKIFPVFQSGEARYCLIRHSLLMKMKFKETIDTSDKENTEQIISNMEEQFGKGNVRLDARSNTLHVYTIAEMVAIRDQYTPDWTFMNLNKNNPALLNMLFSKEVINKLNEYD